MTDGHTGVTTSRGEVHSCSLVDVLQRVGDKWSILVMAAFDRRPHRFRQLLREVDGISQRMLTLTLHRLERDGLVVRTVIDTRPPGVEYALTGMGRSLTVPLRSLRDWAEENRPTIARHRADWDARHDQL